MLDDIFTYIVAQSTAFTKWAGTSGNIGKAIMLDGTAAPDTFVSLYESQGLASAMTFSTSTGSVSVVFERPRLQLISRSSDYATARSNAETIFVLLNGLSKKLPTSTGTLYLSIEAVQSPFHIGRDENDRHMVSCNFQVEKEVG